MPESKSACTVGYANHVGIAVTNVREALLLYQTLFDSPETSIIEAPLLGIRAAIIVQGETHIELLEPTDPAGAIGRFIAEHGEGLHHLAFNVNNVDKKVEELKALGIRMIDQVPRQGLTGRIAFIHPSATRGSLIELVQPSARAAH
ncbi:MAG: methylmalonyl-CoA epimerase [SAR202 cluster bacterium]|nr:methylmalonyl-CoA epimerase [SAR202 cluster bacterium]